MENTFKAVFLNQPKDFLESLPERTQAKVIASITVMQEGDFQSIKIKTLRGPIKELIVKSNRFVFFVMDHTIYVVRAFLKKTAKTPKREIEYAEQVHSTMFKK